MPIHKPIHYGVLAALAAGAIVVRLSLAPALGRELHPGPDAVEYAETARRLARFEGFGLDVSGVVFPSRYPVCFAFLLVPAVYAFGGDAMHYSTFMAALGGLSVFLAGLFAWRFLGRFDCAVLVALWVACSPAHIHYSHFVMSDLPMAILYQMLALMAWKSRHGSPSSAFVFASGLLLGALAAIRLPALPVAASVALFFAWRLWPARKPLLIFLAGAVVFPLFEAVNRLLSFGSVFADAYAYYVPSFRPGSGFAPLSLGWVLESEGGARTPNLVYYGRLLLGLDDSLIKAPWLLGVLALLGAIALLVRARPDRWSFRFIAWVLLLGPGGLLALHLAYFWQSPRVILLLLPALACLAAAGLREVVLGLLRLGPTRMRSAPRAKTLMFSLLAAAMLCAPAGAAYRALRFPVEDQGLNAALRSDLKGRLENIGPVLITNIGVLRARNLLFPGAGEPTPWIVSISDAMGHDEHVYRNNRQEPIYRQKADPQYAPTIARWSSAEDGGSGEPALNAACLEQIRAKLAGRSALIFLRPDATAEAIVEMWRREPDWQITPLDGLAPFRCWTVRSESG